MRDESGVLREAKSRAQSEIECPARGRVLEVCSVLGDRVKWTIPKDCPSVTRLLSGKQFFPARWIVASVKVPGRVFLCAGRKEKVVADSFVGECPKEQPMRGIQSPAQSRGEEGVTASMRRPREETARLGKEIYERDIRRQVEADHHGETVAIDVDSGTWVVARGEIAAVDRLRNMPPRCRQCVV